MAAMSVSLSVGLAGVSMKTSRVFGWIACATATGSEVSTNDASTSKCVEHLLEETDRAAIHDVGNDDVVAGLQDSEKERRDGGHAGRETNRGRRVFQRAQRSFQRRHRRVGGARVGEALVNADGFLVVSGGLINRGKDGAGGRIGRNAAAHCRSRKQLSARNSWNLSNRKLPRNTKDRLLS